MLRVSSKIINIVAEKAPEKTKESEVKNWLLPLFVEIQSVEENSLFTWLDIIEDFAINDLITHNDKNLKSTNYHDNIKEIIKNALIEIRQQINKNKLIEKLVLPTIHNYNTGKYLQKSHYHEAEQAYQKLLDHYDLNITNDDINWSGFWSLVELNNKGKITNLWLGDTYDCELWQKIYEEECKKSGKDPEFTGRIKSGFTGVDFGPIYNQFENKPKEAIQHLLKVRKGECPKALYREDIGYVDIVWGENDPKTNKGYGLKHIVEKHGKELKELGFNVEDFIPVAFTFGVKSYDSEPIIKLKGEKYIVIIKTRFNETKKRYLLTAYDLRPVKTKQKRSEKNKSSKRSSKNKS